MHNDRKALFDTSGASFGDVAKGKSRDFISPLCLITCEGGENFAMLAPLSYPNSLVLRARVSNNNSDSSEESSQISSHIDHSQISETATNKENASVVVIVVCGGSVVSEDLLQQWSVI